MCALNAVHRNRPGENRLLVMALPQSVPGAPSAALRVEDSAGTPVRGIRPTGFSLTAGGLPVFQYDVQERNAHYETCWEPPSSKHTTPVEIFVQTSSARGALTLHLPPAE